MNPIKLPKCQIRRELNDLWFANPTGYHGPVWRVELHDPGGLPASYVAEFAIVLYSDAVKLAHRIAAECQTHRIAAARAQIESITP